MSTTVKAGWLKDKDGNKFAPKTMSSQVFNDDGTLLKDNIELRLDEISIQPNWNQNDESAIDHIKNRTHWAEVSEVTIVSENVTVEGDGYAQFSGEFPQLIVGQTYIVTVNGVVYECVARLFTDGVLIGNGTIYGDDNEGNGEPFSCDSYDNNTLYFNASVGEYNVSITTIQEVVHTIDKKYLPSLVGKNVEGETFTIDKEDVVAQKGAEIFNDYEGNIATGEDSHAEGWHTIASGNYSHAEGSETRATGWISHAEGFETTASGIYSHAEGQNTTASEKCSHAEGQNTTSSGQNSHAEGSNTVASGITSHTEGSYTIASGIYSHAEGSYTIASGNDQHVQGRYNIADTENIYAHIVGNGDNSVDTEYKEVRSNAHTLDWQGNAWFNGNVYVGGTSGTNIDEGSKKLITAEEVPQSDWNENNESSASYINNKPFYITKEPEEISVISDILPENSYEFNNEGNVSTYYSGIKHDFVIDKAYTVVWDGTVYELTAYDESGVPVIGAYFGDIYGGTATIPFVIYMNLREVWGVTIVTNDTVTTSHTVRIYETNPSIDIGEMHIESKYAPHFQADWNENDKYDISYIRNRPFSSHIEDIVVIDNAQIEFTAEEGVENLFFGNINTDNILDNKLEYKIVWNGETYYTKPYVLNGMSTLGAEIINPATMTIDFSKYPFMIGIYESSPKSATPYSNGIAFIYTNSSETTTLSITAEKEIVNKIPDKYIPQPNWGETDKSKASYIANKPFGDKIINETVIVEQTEVEINNGYVNIPKPLNIEIGKTYHVTLNGIVYTCVAWGGSYGSIYIGNGSLDDYNGKGEDVPFVIYTYQGDEFYLTVVEDGTYILKISEGTVETTPINERYIPDMTSLVLLSPNGTRFSITVGDDGVLSATEITA